MVKGEHIKVKKLGYFHHGIYIGDDKVVHYSKINAKAEVKETSLKEFLDKGKFEIVKYNDSLHMDEVVLRAKSLQGKTEYNLIFNNCEHLASWCKTGQRTSKQVDNTVVGGVIVAKTITPVTTMSLAKKFAVSAVVDYAFSAYMKKSRSYDIEVAPYQKPNVIYCNSRGDCFYRLPSIKYSLPPLNGVFFSSKHIAPKGGNISGRGNGDFLL